ncbi:MAG: hypothetical protein RBG13Loki_2285 [Promethearchaeota archaeon CR_4]|nr:MAG: hypothetical protein RBG13Loki_2285 [Candidatus Lokiarchaeota archaeon CR_4]
MVELVNCLFNSPLYIPMAIMTTKARERYYCDLELRGRQTKDKIEFGNINPLNYKLYFYILNRFTRVFKKEGKKEQTRRKIPYFLVSRSFSNSLISVVICSFDLSFRSLRADAFSSRSRWSVFIAQNGISSTFLCSASYGSITP